MLIWIRVLAWGTIGGGLLTLLATFAYAWV